MRALLRGEGLLRASDQPELPEFRPIARDLRALIRDMAAERHPRDEERFDWSPDALRAVLRDELRNQEVIVVSNREPYIHVRHGDGIEVQRPASGMVTALEPIMRTCSGTWIAHGSGSADREVVDRTDRIAVPPEAPAYRLRRVWLSEAEENGLLLRVLATRACGRSATSRTSGRRSARRTGGTTSTSTAGSPKRLWPRPPRATRSCSCRTTTSRSCRACFARPLPAATIITFWHIPWPNPEAFAICPWREELLDGLLGSSILGLPHAVPLQQLLRHGRSTARGARRSRDVHASPTAAASRP